MKILGKGSIITGRADHYRVNEWIHGAEFLGRLVNAAEFHGYVPGVASASSRLEFLLVEFRFADRTRNGLF